MLFKNYSTSVLAALLGNNWRTIIIYRILGNILGSLVVICFQWLPRCFPTSIFLCPTAAYSLEIFAYSYRVHSWQDAMNVAQITSAMLAINQTVTSVSLCCDPALSDHCDWFCRYKRLLLRLTIRRFASWLPQQRCSMSIESTTFVQSVNKKHVFYPYSKIYSFVPKHGTEIHWGPT
jgi:hypothetical protein